MKKLFTNALLASMLIVGGVSAQEKAEKRADKNFDRFAYVDAIKTYERIANKGYKNASLLQNLGDSYYFNSDFENAAKWYGELFTISTDAAPEYYYRYAQSLKAIGQNAKADEMLATFSQKNAADSRAGLYQSQKNYREIIAKNSGRYKLEDAGINSSASDYGTTVYKGNVIFTTARDTGNFAKRTHNWDGKYLTNFFQAEQNPDGSLQEPRPLRGSVKTRFHESTAAFSADGKTMYFTRNNFVDGKRGRGTDNKTRLKIYSATLKDSMWANITALPFTSDDYSAAHPAISPDGKTLYFASDMPGGFGGSDLYQVAINADGTFGTPQNLGAGINTPGRESFPFVSGDNELYFSSDGFPGLGGFDIFVSKIEDGKFGEVINVGADANSPKDDFGYYINHETRKGFLSSNRDGGKGSDDIYKFVENKKLEMKTVQELAGRVEDGATAAVIPNATITLSDENFNVIKTVKTDAQGKYELGEVETGKKYYVKAEAPGYITKEHPIIISSGKEKTELPIFLDPESRTVKVGDNLADAFKIRNIYFDFDKADIRQDGAVDLAKILDVLEKNPTMKLDIQSHTDSRGAAKYNQKLSERRAQATLKWLLSNGVAKDRLTAKGYGESQLVNKCADNVDCSEDEHQLNRRSLFVITAL